MARKTLDALYTRVDRCLHAGSPGDGSELDLMRELATKLKTKDYSGLSDLKARTLGFTFGGSRGDGEDMAVLTELLAALEKKAAAWKDRS